MHIGPFVVGAVIMMLMNSLLDVIDKACLGRSRSSANSLISEQIGMDRNYTEPKRAADILAYTGWCCLY